MWLAKKIESNQMVYINEKSWKGKERKEEGMHLGGFLNKQHATSNPS